MSLADPIAPASGAPDPPPPGDAGRSNRHDDGPADPRLRGTAWWHAPAIVLGLALLSFALPSVPTYDPWAWIIWGREITQLDLMTTDGPSWKPLPVLFTTVFALLGDAAPDLWLLVARAGAIAGAWVAFLLGKRLADGSTVAGLFAAGAYAAAPWTLRHGLLGNSEGLFVALLLGAVLLELQGRHRWAFAAALGCALLRPEAWPFVGLYGLWRFWRGDRLLVAAGFASLPALWLLPEWWGSGDPFRASNRAQQPNPDSPAFAEHPWWEIVKQFAAMLPLGAWLGLAALAVLAWRVRRGRTVAAVAALSAAWVALVAVMTEGGFAGNTRYLIPGAALALVLAGAGAGLALRRLPVAVAGALALAVAVLPQASGWDDELRLNRDQAALVEALPVAIDRAGGREAVLACGPVVTGPYQVPAVAWELGVHTSQVLLRPQERSTLLRSRNFPDQPARPSLRGFDTPLRTLAVTPRWRVLQTCGARP